jgi:hypothetical protein
MAELFLLDPRRSNFVAIVGRKGSGKSTLARRFFNGYPFDKVVIDVTGDEGAAVPGVQEIRDPLPLRWPTNADRTPTVLRYQPDMGSATVLEDTDVIFRWAMTHQKRSAVWVDENESIMPVQRTPANALRLLHQGRHRNVTLIVTQIRPVHVNRLVFSQADYVAVYQVPDPDDRKTIAKSIGWPPREFDELVHGLAPYEFLWYDAHAHELAHCDPIPVG